MAPIGKVVKPEEFTVITRSGVQIFGYYDVLPSGEMRPRTHCVDASWF